MLYLWMPEANGVWQWSRGSDWTTSSSLEQLIQDIKLYQGEEAVVFFPSREVQILQQKFSKAQYKQAQDCSIYWCTWLSCFFFDR